MPRWGLAEGVGSGKYTDASHRPVVPVITSDCHQLPVQSNIKFSSMERKTGYEHCRKIGACGV